MSEYLSSFNGGELSPLLTPRTDLPIYKNGCATLRNFYVQPQGSVERRQGSEYITSAIGDESRLITFKFSSDESYIIELSASSIKAFDGTGAVISTIDSPFDATDIPDIKYVQSVDIIYMVCPGKPVQTLSRTSISPVTFVIEELLFDYAPFIDENTDSDKYISILSPTWLTYTDYVIGDKISYDGIQYTCTVTHTSGFTFSGVNWQEIAPNTSSYLVGSTVTLYSNEGIFPEGIDNSYFRLSHQRANETILLDGSVSGNPAGTVGAGSKVFDPVYVGGISVSINYNAWINSGSLPIAVLIEKKTGVAGAWSTETSFSAPSNGTYTFVGGGDDYIRITLSGIDYITGKDAAGSSFSITEAFVKRVEFTSNSDLITQSESLDVSFSDWDINTTGTWTGALELEKSTDGGGTWNTIATIADTASLAAENVTVSSDSKEGANTLIRLRYDYSSGTLVATLTNTTFRSEGVVKINNWIDANSVEGVVVSKLLSNATTNRWSFGAFSEARGYPSAIEFFDSRLVFSGTIQDPSRVYMSYTEDYTNFLTGVRDSDAIQVTPNTNEPCTWLLSRGDSLYQGTRGSVVTIGSTNGNAITPINIQARESLEFGGSTIQGIKTNETVVYLERLNKKLREVYYNDDEKGLVSRDLTIMSNEIADGGFTELVLQRTPDQIIYGLRTDGLIAGLTYERSQDVFGWSVFDFGGIVSSIAVRPSGTHDELWVTIERDNGRFIERLGTREFSDDLLDAWYVDSGIKTVLIGTQNGVITIGAAEDFKITVTKTAHGLSDGDFIRMSGVTSLPELNDHVYVVADSDANTFILKDETNTIYINALLYDVPETMEVSGATYSAFGDTPNGTYTQIGTAYGRPIYSYTYIKESTGAATQYIIEFDGTEWKLSRNTNLPFPEAFYKNTSIDGRVPKTGWVLDIDGSGDAPVIDYDGWWVDPLSGDFTQVSNVWTGHGHLNASTVQIQGDGGFAGTAIVDSGVVETDYFYNQVVIGLRYFSILRPMYIEASGFTSQNYNKNVKSAVIGFYRTINGYSGNMLQSDDRTPEFDFEELESDWPDLDKTKYSLEPIKFRKYNDGIGQPIIPLTGSKKVNYLDTLSRIKSMFVIADLPMPMTVTSLALKLRTGGR